MPGHFHHEVKGKLRIFFCLSSSLLILEQPVRLQISPPSLPYVRSLRIAVDTAVRFVPRSTGVEVNHPGGRVFILSDLFLLGEVMAPGEKSTESPGADMWLLYPPLAGKHLKVAKVENEGWVCPYSWTPPTDHTRCRSCVAGDRFKKGKTSTGILVTGYTGKGAL